MALMTEALLRSQQRVRTLKQFARYILVGGSAFGVDIAFFALARLINGQDLLLANVLARLFGALWAFVLNHHWAFKPFGKRSLWRSALRYGSLWSINTTLSTLLMAMAFGEIGPSHIEVLAKVGVEIVIVSFNYLVCRIWVFK